jgi:hypothetical protein
MAMLVSQEQKGKNVKTRGVFAPAKNQLFSPAFFHESREIYCYGRSSGLRPNLFAFPSSRSYRENSGFVE